jgi:hypothetical protein
MKTVRRDPAVSNHQLVMSSECASPARTETSLTISLQKIRDLSTSLGPTKTLAEMNLQRRGDLAALDTAAGLVVRNSNSEHYGGVAGETESAGRFVKIFAEGKHLKIPAQHFRMKQSLEGAFFRSVKGCVWKKS